MVCQACGNETIVGLLKKAAAAAIPNGLVDLAKIGLVGAHTRVDVSGQSVERDYIYSHQQKEQQTVGVKPCRDPCAHDD